MPVSQYFNHSDDPFSADQLLREDLLNELVQQRGINVYYILRESADEVDMLLGEDPTSAFNKAFLIGVLPNDTEDWSAGESFFSKYGLLINKQLSIVVTSREFTRYVGTSLRTSPLEGDLIYIPVFRKLFEIKKSEEETDFYAHGKKLPYHYTLYLEMYKYSHEPIDTGIDEIDILELEAAHVTSLYMQAGSGNYYVNEMVYQGASANSATASASVKNWNPSEGILDIYAVKGTFETSANVIGSTSGTIRILATYDILRGDDEHRYSTNADIESEANTWIVTTEVNPFGNM